MSWFGIVLCIMFIVCVRPSVLGFNEVDHIEINSIVGRLTMLIEDQAAFAAFIKSASICETQIEILRNAVWNIEEKMKSMRLELEAMQCNVKMAPTITLKRKNVSVVQNTIASFFCEANSQSPQDLHWEIDGKKINPARKRYGIFPYPNGTALRIDNVKKKFNNTVITCVASNEHGVTRANASLGVYRNNADVAGFPKITKHPELVRLSVGQTASLKCAAEPTLDDPVNIYWLKDKTPVNTSDSRIHTDVSGTLTIESVRTSDQAKYECLAENSVGVAYSLAAMVYVKDGPVIDMSKTNVTVQEGERAVLTCAVDNLGGHKVVWIDQSSNLLTFEDRRLIDDPRISVERPYIQDWNLHIRETTFRDGGNYTCQINTNPVQTKTVVLNVIDGPVIDMSKTNVTVQEGERAVLTCAVDNLGGHKVVWTYQSSILLTLDDRRIVDDPRISIERPYIRDWTLHIRKTTPNDRGNYTCQINTNPVQTKTVVLNVIAKPTLDGSESYVTVEEGDTAILTCAVDDLGEHKVVWSDWRSTLLTLDDRRAHDDPRMSIERPSKRDWNLYIRNTTYEDRGKYTCQINTNPVLTKTVFLNFKDKSTEPPMSAPRNVTARSLSLDSILIEWEEPETINDIITGYGISYTTSPENPTRIWHKLEVSGNNRNVTITSLLPNDIYTLTVYAFSTSNIGPMSVPVQVLTRDRVKPVTFKSVTNVTVEESDTAILPCVVANPDANMVVTWLDPWPSLLTMNDRRIVSDRRISVERPSALDWNLHIRETTFNDRGSYSCQINTKPGQTKTVILNVIAKPKLDVSKPYVTVEEGETAILACAVDDLGKHKVVWSGEWSNLLTLDDRRVHDDPRMSIERPSKRDWNLFIRDTTYKDREPLLKPRNVQTKSISPGEITVSWDKVSEADKIEGYILHYNSSYEDSTGNVTIPNSDSMFTITNLIPSTIYHVQLEAIGVNGERTISETVQEKTQEFIPKEPRNVKGRVVNATTIHVEWRPPLPKTLTQFISNYNVTCYQLDQFGNYVYEDRHEVTTQNGDITEVVLYGLKPNTEYAVSVSANTRAGGGIHSEMSYISTRLYVPSEPRNVSAEVLTENPWIFIITWSEPEYTGGDITRYKIVSPVHKMERILAPDLRTFITPEMTSPDQINGVQIYAGNSIGYGPPASIYFTG